MKPSGSRYVLSPPPAAAAANKSKASCLSEIQRLQRVSTYLYARWDGIKSSLFEWMEHVVWSEYWRNDLICVCRFLPPKLSDMQEDQNREREWERESERESERERKGDRDWDREQYSIGERTSNRV